MQLERFIGRFCGYNRLKSRLSHYIQGQLCCCYPFISLLLSAFRLSVRYWRRYFLVSVRATLRSSNNRGTLLSAQLEKLKADIDRPLASILTLNTIAHTIGAATAGAQAAVVFGSEALGIFSAVLTLAILVLSEIVPKTIGATYWRQLAPSAAVSLRWMVWALTPFVWFSEQITKRLARNHEAPKMRDELSAMVPFWQKRAESSQKANQRS